MSDRHLSEISLSGNGIVHMFTVLIFIIFIFSVPTFGQMGSSSTYGMRRFLCLAILLGTFAVSVGCSIYHDVMVSYHVGALHAREDVLKIDLRAFRQGIKQYTSEKGVAPQSLDDLVRAGYVHQISPDPITGERNWRVILAPAEYPSKRPPGIVDVRSAAVGKSSDGSLYSEW